MEGAVNGDRALNGLRDTLERCHERVAHRLYLGAAVLLCDFAGNRLVRAKNGVAQAHRRGLTSFCVADEVGEENCTEGTGRRFSGRLVASRIGLKDA
jgi:hypothetical protein